MSDFVLSVLAICEGDETAARKVERIYRMAATERAHSALQESSEKANVAWLDGRAAMAESKRIKDVQVYFSNRRTAHLTD